MLSNGACHLGNDVFVAGMADIDDSVFVVFGGDCEELPLERTVEWHYGRGASSQKASSSLSSPTALSSRCHTTHASPNGRFVLGLSALDKKHYLIDTDGGAVTIFETRDVVKSVCWHPLQADLCLLLLADGDVDVYNVSVPIRGSLLRKVVTIPLLRLIHAMLGQSSGGLRGGSNSGAFPPSGSHSPSQSPSQERTHSYNSPLSMARKSSNGNLIRSIPIKGVSATPQQGGRGNSPLPVVGEKGREAPASLSLTYSQRCVLNSYNNTLVEFLVSLSFISPIAGQPLLLAALASNGDVYVVKLSESTCAPVGLATDKYSTATKSAQLTGEPDLQLHHHTLKAFEEEDPFEVAFSAGRGGGGEGSHAQPPYVRLLISSSANNTNNNAEVPLPIALTLNTFLVDVRSGRVGFSILYSDGVVRTYYLRPDELVTPTPSSSSSASALRRQCAAMMAPIRTHPDHETALTSPFTPSSKLPHTEQRVSSHQSTNAVLYRVDDQMFLFAFPIWLRKDRVWSLRFPAEGEGEGALQLHRGGSGVLPLSSDESRVPCPLALRVPFEGLSYSSSIGTNDILLLPVLMSDETEPIIIKIEHLLETAMMAMHRKGVRVLNGGSSMTNEVQRSNSGATVGSLALALSSSSSTIQSSPSSSTRAAVSTIQKLAQTVANGCASFYAGEEYAVDDVNALVADAEDSLIVIYRTLTEMDSANRKESGKIRAALAAAETQQSALVFDYQRMLDIANKKDAHQHGVQSLFEVSKMLGELHQRLLVLEAEHVGDEDKIDRAVAAIRQLNAAGSVPTV